MKRLDEIAHRDGSFTPLQCINKKIVHAKEDGMEEKVKNLKRIRLLCVVYSLNSM